MKIKTDPFLIFIIISLVAIYLAVALKINPGLSDLSPRPYYNNLVDSLLQGRVDISSKVNHDLSLFNGKWYVYWGIAPVIFILPFYLLEGIRVSDIFYTLIAGLLNIVIFYKTAEAFLKYFKITINRSSICLVLISFSLISPNFYLSLAGRIWHTNQIISVFYLLLFLLFYFKFLSNLDKTYFFILSGIFYNLAWLSRYTLVFYGLLFLYPLSLVINNKKIFKRAISLLIVMAATSLLLFFSYNYLRFQNPLETGFKYQVGSERYRRFLEAEKLFSPDYASHNITYYFLNHLPVSLEKPYVRISIEGNSVFSVYPTLLFLFFLFQKKYLKNKNLLLFLLIAALAVGANLLLLMLNLGTGWAQFGNRYFFDVIPILFLLTLLVIENFPIPVRFMVIVYGALVNLFGSLAFYQIMI